MVLRVGIWEEDARRLLCPYCGRRFQPRSFSNISVKQCPACHRYFILPKNLVLEIVRNPDNMGIVRSELRRIVGIDERKTDKELQAHVIELIENEKLSWDERGLFLRTGEL